MLEILKSKVMMGFAIILLGIVFVNTNATVKMEENVAEATQNLITMHIQ